MKSIALFGASILVLFLVFKDCSANHRSDYEEPCNITQRCKGRAWLSCQGGICECFRKDEMFYDVSKGKCVSRAGEKCRYSVAETDIPIIETTDCVPFSECNNSGVCTCIPSHYETFNGTCNLKGIKGSSCSEDSQCRSEFGFACLNNTCSCVPGAVYVESRGQCVGLADQACVNQNCISGAECSNNNDCVCLENYYKSSESYCRLLKGHLESCNDHTECNSKQFLGCNDGVCSCNTGTRFEEPVNGMFRDMHDTVFYQQNYYGQNYAFKQFPKQCVGLANMQCVNSACTINAECVLRNLDFKCRCNSDFIESTDGTCRLGIGKSCSSENKCADTFVCKEDVCACKSPLYKLVPVPVPDEDGDGDGNPHEHAYADAECRSTVSGPCNSDNDCIKMAHCEFSGDSPASGRCECNPGYMEAEDGDCDAGFHSFCNKTSQRCDRYAGLKCIDDKCRCEDASQIYIPAFQNCVQLVEGICKPYYKKPVCVPNATCQLGYDGKNGEIQHRRPRCKCQKGFIMTEARTCKQLDRQNGNENDTNKTSNRTGKAVMTRTSETLEDALFPINAAAQSPFQRKKPLTDYDTDLSDESEN